MRVCELKGTEMTETDRQWVEWLQGRQAAKRAELGESVSARTVDLELLLDLVQEWQRDAANWRGRRLIVLAGQLAKGKAGVSRDIYIRAS